MTKFLSLLAVPALTLIATAAAASEPTKSFKHEGVTYIYEATPGADGSTVLTGHALPRGEKFRLVVRNGQVTGQANRQPVSFSVAGTRGAAQGAVVVERSVRVTAAD